jgi:hypothetical protein
VSLLTAFLSRFSMREPIRRRSTVLSASWVTEGEIDAALRAVRGKGQLKKVFR